MTARGLIRSLFIIALVAGLAFVAQRIPEALAHLEAFRVEEVRIEGERFLSLEDLAPILEIPSSASVWDDLQEWEERLLAHPLVLEARIRRRFPRTLVLEVKEREPVALVATPTLEPVDRSGRVLPIDPTRHQMDLPLIGTRAGLGLGDLTPAERALLVGEVARISEVNPGLASQLSEIVVEGRGYLRARIWDPKVDLLLRPGTAGHRLKKGLDVLGDALVRFGAEGVVALDLRFDDQVVVRLKRPVGS
jgi:cell division protein FtsQ